MANGQSLKLVPYLMLRIEDVSSTTMFRSPIFTVSDIKLRMIFHQHDGKSTICIVPEVENLKSRLVSYTFTASVSIMVPDKSFKDFLFIQKTTHHNRSGFNENHLVWEVESKILDNLDIVQEKNGKKNVTFLCVFGLLGKYQKAVTDLNNIWLDSICYEKLRKDIEDLRLNQDSSIVLKCGNKMLKAHEVILSARSDKFAKMFQDKNETENEVEIKDMEFEILENIITYIYTGQLKDSRPSEKLLIKLYDTASEYEILNLMTLLGIKLTKILTKEELSSTMEEEKERLTVLTLELLLKAHDYDDDSFKDSIMQSIVEVNDFILKEEKWKVFRTNNKFLAMEVYKCLGEHVKSMTEGKAENLANIKG